MARRVEGWTLYHDTRRDLYYARFRHEGRRYCLSTGTGDPGEAPQIASWIYAEVVSGRRHPEEVPRIAPARGLPLDEIGAKWLAEVETSLDPLTFRQYSMYVSTHWHPFFSTTDRLTTLSVDDYKARRLRLVKRGTLNKELGALRSLVRWAREHGFISDVPEIKNPNKRVIGTPSRKQNHKSQPVALGLIHSRGRVAYVAVTSWTDPCDAAAVPSWMLRRAA